MREGDLPVGGVEAGFGRERKLHWSVPFREGFHFLTVLPWFCVSGFRVQNLRFRAQGVRIGV